MVADAYIGDSFCWRRYSPNSDHAYFGPVLGKVNPNSCCVPNLKSLASVVAEIGVPIFSPKPPPILVLKVVFGKLLSKAKLYTKHEVVVLKRFIQLVQSICVK